MVNSYRSSFQWPIVLLILVTVVLLAPYAGCRLLTSRDPGAPADMLAEPRRIPNTSPHPVLPDSVPDPDQPHSDPHAAESLPVERDNSSLSEIEQLLNKQ